jgi:DNA-binding ferritin-like protein (Dps family)
MATLIERITGDLEGKRRWRDYKARAKALPQNYRVAVEAIERYLMYFGSISSDMSIFEDLIDLFERAAADGTSIRGIVGDDPVAFVEEFKENYMKDGWVARERARFTEAIARAADEPVPESGEGS